jgi:hypothetical protein
MYQVYQLTDDGFEQSLGYYQDLKDADDALDEWSEWRPHAYIDIREVN